MSALQKSEVTKEALIKALQRQKPAKRWPETVNFRKSAGAVPGTGISCSYMCLRQQPLYNSGFPGYAG